MHACIGQGAQLSLALGGCRFVSWLLLCIPFLRRRFFYLEALDGLVNQVEIVASLNVRRRWSSFRTRFVDEWRLREIASFASFIRAECEFVAKEPSEVKIRVEVAAGCLESIVTTFVWHAREHALTLPERAEDVAVLLLQPSPHDFCRCRYLDQRGFEARS